MPASSPRRGYRSQVRDEARRLTVRRCVRAAAELFLAQGYAATTIDAVAERAGVARRTVFTAVGGKPTLLKLAYDWSLVGDDEPVPMAQRPEILAIAAEKRPRVAVRLWAEHVTTVAGRSTGMMLVLRVAADTDAEAAAVHDKAMVDARLGSEMFVRHLTRIGTLRADLDVPRATDLVWALLDPGVYDRMVLRGAWTPAQFAAWLARVWDQTLIGRASSPRHSSAAR